MKNRGLAAAPLHRDLFGTPNIKDQGSICGGHESRNDLEPSISASVMARPWLNLYGGYSTEFRSPSLGGGGGQFQSVDPAFYALAKGAYSQVGVKMHLRNAPELKNFILGAAYCHIDYTNQEIDFETAGNVEISAGGSSTYQGVNAYFDDDPFSNLHFFANVNGEGSHFTTYVTGAPNTAVRLTIIQNAPPGQAPSCAIYNNLPVSYVPNSTFNVGAYYGIRHYDKVLVEPRFWIDHLGSQHMFDNCGFSAAVGGCTNAVPSNQTMPSYTTTNLSFTGSPIKYLNLSISMENLFNKKYNEYEYISSGGYFGVGSNYILAYPGAPLTTYGTVSFQF